MKHGEEKELIRETAAFHLALILEKSTTEVEPSGRRMTNQLNTWRLFPALNFEIKFGFW